MENLNIFGICLKIWFLGRVSQKTNTERKELPNKGVLGQLADLRKGGGGGGAWKERGRSVFEAVFQKLRWMVQPFSWKMGTLFYISFITKKKEMV